MFCIYTTGVYDTSVYLRDVFNEITFETFANVILKVSNGNVNGCDEDNMTSSSLSDGH